MIRTIPPPRVLTNANLPSDSPSTDAEWDFVERMGWDVFIEREMAGDTRVGSGWAKSTAEALVNYRETVGASSDLERRAEVINADEEFEGELEERRLAISLILAREAAAEPRVVSFRANRLSGRLIRLEEVDEWVTTQAERDGLPTMYVQVPLPVGTVVKYGDEPGTTVFNPPLTLSVVEAPWVSVSALSLRYGDSEQRTRSIPTTAGGVLDELRGLSEFLAGFYGWHEDQATVFVLTGITPLVGSIYTRLVYRPNVPAASRIELSIDPSTAADEVKAAFIDAFREMVPGRYRRISLKHVRLAALGARGRPKIGSPTEWSELMAEWNARLPEESRDRYTTVTNFARDCARAIERLLKPAFAPAWGTPPVTTKDAAGEMPGSEAGESVAVRRIVRGHWYRRRTVKGSAIGDSTAEGGIR